jgi:hypothetical protein
MADEPVEAELHADSHTRYKFAEHRFAKSIDRLTDKVAAAEATPLNGRAKTQSGTVVIPQRAPGITLSGKVL